MNGGESRSAPRTTDPPWRDCHWTSVAQIRSFPLFFLSVHHTPLPSPLPATPAASSTATLTMDVGECTHISHNSQLFSLHSRRQDDEGAGAVVRRFNLLWNERREKRGRGNRGKGSDTAEMMISMRGSQEHHAEVMGSRAKPDLAAGCREQKRTAERHRFQVERSVGARTPRMGRRDQLMHPKQLVHSLYSLSLSVLQLLTIIILALLPSP